ncbi:MAG: (2Fe-2S)-binding protein [Actinomycetota bacterium]
MVVCHCNLVNDRTINRLAKKAGRELSVSDVTDHCGAGGNCGGCVNAIEEILEARANDAARRR